MKQIFLALGLLLSNFAHAETIITCDDGFEFNVNSGKLSISNSASEWKTEILDHFLFSGATSMTKDGLVWDKNKNAYFASDRYSTIYLYYYDNGERALSLVGKRWGYEDTQIKYGNCDF